ncbi:MAG: EAL domain-containing protein [Solirubrobacterales bacterium]
MLQEACRQGASWRASGHTIGMAVNVSGRQLDTDAFVADVRSTLSQGGLDASALTLEITETTLMRNVDETTRRRRLAAIRELGVRIAIDDFGTGYSSLAHLQQFPVNALKIDRSFVSRLTQNPEGDTLIHTLVQLGKALSIETLAEGIEQQQELSMLQEERCDSGQGFLFARPLDASAAEAFLQPGPAALLQHRCMLRAFSEKPQSSCGDLRWERRRNPRTSSHHNSRRHQAGYARSARHLGSRLGTLHDGLRGPSPQDLARTRALP